MLMDRQKFIFAPPLRLRKYQSRDEAVTPVQTIKIDSDF